MPFKILILGASYGSLLGSKFAAAGHDVTLVCRTETANLINTKGTEVRIKLRNEDAHRSFFSRDLAGSTVAVIPEQAKPEEFDLVCLAMQEPQYSHPSLRDLLARTAQAKVACMSIMNMPPLPYMKRIPALDCGGLRDAYLNPEIWDLFDPSLMTLCSPDPQAFRPPEEGPNILHVGLPTNFKVSKFDDPELDGMLQTLETDINAYRIDGKDVPVKLRVFDSLFVPFAKWAMLATGNYRCITADGPQSIKDAVHGDIAKSEEIYDFVNDVVERLGADPADMVPFRKYAAAAQNLLKPSSAARAVFSGAKNIERVDKLTKLTASSLGMSHPANLEAVQIVDALLIANQEETA
ncbi:MAG: 2-dehydropantoate 2-reductase N-terminal domain-containing protein [Paracoccaceae bacterium]